MLERLLFRRHKLEGAADGPSTCVPPRVLLFFIAIPIQLLAEVFYWVLGKGNNLGFMVAAVLLWCVWFLVVFILATSCLEAWLKQHSRWLMRGFYAVLVLAVCIILAEAVGLHLLHTGSVEENELTEKYAHSFTYNDSTALCHQASENLLAGYNPYSQSDLLAAVEELHVRPTALTPLMQGGFEESFPYPTEEQICAELRDTAQVPGEPPEFVDRVSYPAGAFLFHTPFVAMGFSDLRIFYLVCACLAGGLVFALAPGRLKLLVPATGLVSIGLWNMIACGTLDTLYVLFILLGWIAKPRWVLSALFIGLAASTKQIAWLYVPFWLIWIQREDGWKPMFRSMGMAAIVFGFVNLPFVFSAPREWAMGVMGPVWDPLFPRGVGLVNFSIAGILPPSPVLFTALEIAVLMAGAAWFWARGYKHPQVGLLLAALPLFFAWRSYSCYFCFAPLLIFGVLLAQRYRKEMRPLPVPARGVS